MPFLPPSPLGSCRLHHPSAAQSDDSPVPTSAPHGENLPPRSMKEVPQTMAQPRHKEQVRGGGGLCEAGGAGDHTLCPMHLGFCHLGLCPAVVVWSSAEVGPGDLGILGSC